MRWFRAAFAEYVDEMGKTLGCEFDVDTAKLGVVFVRWLEAIRYHRPREAALRRDFFDFAASLMMRELVVNMPVRASNKPKASAPEAAAFWPEGYVCTMFSLSVHAAVVEQEFHARPELSQTLEETSFWWTYRENAMEDPRTAAGFFQLMLGHVPNWTMPDFFQPKASARLT